MGATVALSQRAPEWRSGPRSRTVVRKLLWVYIATESAQYREKAYTALKQGKAVFGEPATNHDVGDDNSTERLISVRTSASHVAPKSAISENKTSLASGAGPAVYAAVVEKRDARQGSSTRVSSFPPRELNTGVGTGTNATGKAGGTKQKNKPSNRSRQARGARGGHKQQQHRKDQGGNRGKANQRHNNNNDSGRKSPAARRRQRSKKQRDCRKLAEELAHQQGQNDALREIINDSQQSDDESTPPESEASTQSYVAPHDPLEPVFEPDLRDCGDKSDFDWDSYFGPIRPRSYASPHGSYVAHLRFALWKLLRSLRRSATVYFLGGSPCRIHSIVTDLNKLYWENGTCFGPQIHCRFLRDDMDADAARQTARAEELRPQFERQPNEFKLCRCNTPSRLFTSFDQKCVCVCEHFYQDRWLPYPTVSDTRISSTEIRQSILFVLGDDHSPTLVARYVREVHEAYWFSVGAVDGSRVVFGNGTTTKYVVGDCLVHTRLLYSCRTHAITHGARNSPPETWCERMRMPVRDSVVAGLDIMLGAEAHWDVGGMTVHKLVNHEWKNRKSRLIAHPQLTKMLSLMGLGKSDDEKTRQTLLNTGRAAIMHGVMQKDGIGPTQLANAVSTVRSRQHEHATWWWGGSARRGRFLTHLFGDPTNPDKTHPAKIAAGGLTVFGASMMLRGAVSIRTRKRTATAGELFYICAFAPLLEERVKTWLSPGSSRLLGALFLGVFEFCLTAVPFGNRINAGVEDPTMVATEFLEERTPALLMHVATGFMPEWAAIPTHMAFNSYMVYKSPSIADKLFDRIEIEAKRLSQTGVVVSPARVGSTAVTVAKCAVKAGKIAIVCGAARFVYLVGKWLIRRHFPATKRRLRGKPKRVKFAVAPVSDDIRENNPFNAIPAISDAACYCEHARNIFDNPPEFAGSLTVKEGALDVECPPKPGLWTMTRPIPADVCRPVVHARCVHNEWIALAVRYMLPPNPLDPDHLRAYEKNAENLVYWVKRHPDRGYVPGDLPTSSQAFIMESKWATARKNIASEMVKAGDSFHPVSPSAGRYTLSVKAERSNSERTRGIFAQSLMKQAMCAETIKKLSNQFANTHHPKSKYRVCYAPGATQKELGEWFDCVVAWCGGPSEAGSLETDGRNFDGSKHLALVRINHRTKRVLLEGLDQEIYDQFKKMSFRVKGCSDHGVKFDREGSQPSGNSDTTEDNTFTLMAAVVDLVERFRSFSLHTGDDVFFVGPRVNIHALRVAVEERYRGLGLVPESLEHEVADHGSFCKGFFWRMRDGTHLFGPDPASVWRSYPYCVRRVPKISPNVYLSAKASGLASMASHVPGMMFFRYAPRSPVRNLDLSSEIWGRWLGHDDMEMVDPSDEARLQLYEMTGVYISDWEEHNFATRYDISIANEWGSADTVVGRLAQLIERHVTKETNVYLARPTSLASECEW